MEFTISRESILKITDLLRKVEDDFSTDRAKDVAQFAIDSTLEEAEFLSQILKAMPGGEAFSEMVAEELMKHFAREFNSYMAMEEEQPAEEEFDIEGLLRTLIEMQTEPEEEDVLVEAQSLSEMLANQIETDRLSKMIAEQFEEKMDEDYGCYVNSDEVIHEILDDIVDFLINYGIDSLGFVQLTVYQSDQDKLEELFNKIASHYDLDDEIEYDEDFAIYVMTALVEKLTRDGEYRLSYIVDGDTLAPVVARL